MSNGTPASVKGSESLSGLQKNFDKKKKISQKKKTNQKKKSVQQPTSQKKKKVEKKKWKRHVEEHGVCDNVADFVTNILEKKEEEEKISDKKKKQSRNDVPNVLIDGVIFHTILNANRWRFVI